LIDNLIYNKGSWVDLTSSGGGETFPPGPTWRQFVSIPPSVEDPGPMPNFVLKCVISLYH